MRRRILQAGAALALGGLLPAARAQNQAWPRKTVRLIVPSAAGSPWDPQARILAERLSQVFGQPFVVENHSGATGMIGMDLVAKADDGHTLGVVFMPHVLIPALFAKVPYDILRDVVPVTQMQWTYNALVVHPSLNVATLDELIALARSKPGELMYASGGNGTPAHVMGENFSRLTGGGMEHIPYRGPVLALQGVIGGQAQLSFASAASTVPHVQSGRLRALAVSAAEPLEALPGVPTFTAAGHPQFGSREWAGIVMDRGAAPGVPERLAGEILRVLADAKLVRQMRDQGVYLHGEGPQGLNDLMRTEMAKWREVVDRLALKLG